MINIYLEFCQKYNIHPLDPSVYVIMCYLEYLAGRLKSPKSISNYWGAVKLLHDINRVHLSNAEDIQVRLMFKSMSLTKRHVSFQKLPLLKHELQQMCSILDTCNTEGLVVKTALLLGFYGFLRASNLCTQKGEKFDNTRHFTRSDVTITNKGLNIHLKWEKNMQNGLQPRNISIPQVQPQYADPVHSFKSMCKLIPAPSNGPLFVFAPGVPMFVGKLRKSFTLLCQAIGLDVASLSLHSLRRGGCSEAYHKGASPLDLQRHGGWHSATFWDYVYPSLTSPSSVCQALSS